MAGPWVLLDDVWELLDSQAPARPAGPDPWGGADKLIHDFRSGAAIGSGFGPSDCTGLWH